MWWHTLNADFTRVMDAGDACAVLAQAKEYVLAELSKTSKGKRLKGFEAIRGVILRTEAFAVDDDTMCAPNPPICRILPTIPVSCRPGRDTTDCTVCDAQAAIAAHEAQPCASVAQVLCADDGNVCRTPSMKLKRPQLSKMYKKQIDDLYKQVNAKLNARG